MQLKASTDYGLRAVLYLAYRKETCSSKDIAEDMSIPRDYLIQLAQLLRNAGILDARPGKNGGYRLAKSADEITLLDIMSALEEDSRNLAKAERAERLEVTPMAEELRRTYDLVLGSYDAYLGSITVALLLECAQDEARSQEFLARQLCREGDRLGAALPDAEHLHHK